MRCRQALVFTLPGLWVVAVVLCELLRPLGTQFTELLAATPAIACAGTGRRQCILLGGACALFALLPVGPSGHTGAGTRAGTCAAILAVIVASYLTTGRRRRLAQELEHAKEVATAAQHALLRPLPDRLDGVALAAGHLAAGRGGVGSVGGDLYEAQSTDHGLRVVMGDVRGHGLPALATVAALLGGFREAAHDEPALPGVLRRLDRTLQRHLRDRADQTEDGAAGGAGEEFVTLLLLQVGPGGEITTLNCGHPWPHRLTPTGAVSLAPGDPLPPLGLFPLPAEPPTTALGPLRPGETLVLHTDGAEDARDAAGAFFPLTGVLAETVHTAPAGGLTPAAVVDRVRDALLRHTGGRLTDDAAVLALAPAHDRPGPAALPAPPPRPALARACRRA
ncbi:membrane protein [Streptomyces mashuensis]|uniref:Membrane protein n=1 Tax=Streptomyces mashuensis TaxID=33904 RepID=A0A919B1R1_9ACTN|nr:membrane protein [Streptomyces mashuensis]